MSDDNLSAEIDREIRASDKIKHIEVSEVIQNAFEIPLAVEDDSPCKSLDSYKATLSGENNSIISRAVIDGEDKSNTHEDHDPISRDADAVTEQVELAPIEESVHDEVVTRSIYGEAATIEHAYDITTLDSSTKTAAAYNSVQLLETMTDCVIDEGARKTLEIVSILVPNGADSDIVSEEVTENVKTTITTGADTDTPTNLVTPELTEDSSVAIALETTMTPAACEENLARLDASAHDLTVTPAAEDDADAQSDENIEVQTTSPAAGLAALIQSGEIVVLDVTTVADKVVSIEVELPRENSQIVGTVMENSQLVGTDNLSVMEADITDTVNTVAADDVNSQVEVAFVAHNEDHCESIEATAVDVSNAETVHCEPIEATAVDISNAENVPKTFVGAKPDTLPAIANSEILFVVAPTLLSAEPADLVLESQIEVGAEGIDVCLVDDFLILQGSVNIDPADSMIPACATQMTLPSTCCDAEISALLPGTITSINGVEEQDSDEAILHLVNALNADGIESMPQEATQPVELAPADTAEHLAEVEGSDDLKMVISEAATISASRSKSMEELHLVQLNDNGRPDISPSDIISLSNEPAQCCLLMSPSNEGGDCEKIDIAYKKDDDMDVHIADHNVLHADNVDQSAFSRECLTPSEQDQSSSLPCVGESRDYDSIQNDDLLKVDTFAKRLDYLNSVDKLNSPKRIHDEDVLDGEAVNEIVVIKESVVVTENIFIQENVFIKESIVIKECITMETTKALYRPASLLKSDKSVSPLYEKILDNIILSDEEFIVDGPTSFQSPILNDNIEMAQSKKSGNERDYEENRVHDDHVEEEVIEADKYVKSKISLFTRLFGKKEVPPVEKTFVPICCSGVLSGSTCYGASAEEKVAVKCDKNADKTTVDMITTEDSDEGFIDA